MSLRRSSPRLARRSPASLQPLEGRRLFAVTLGPEYVFSGDTAPALSVGQQTGPTLADGPGGVSLAVWQDNRSGGNAAIYQGVGLGTMQDIYAARVRADGSVIDVTPIPVAVNSYNQWTPKAAWNGSSWLVSWTGERDDDRYTQDVLAVRVSPGGVVLDATPRVIGATGVNPNGSAPIMPYGPLQVVSDGTDWLVGYRRYNPNTAGGIGMDWFGVRVLADGSVPSAGGTKYLAGDQYYEDFGLAYSPVNGGQYLDAFSYYGSTTLYLRRFDRNLAYIAGSQRTIADAADASYTDQSIAGSPDGWAVAWSGDIAVAVTRVNASGNLIDATPLLASPTQAQTFFSSDVAYNGVDYTVAYSAYPEDYAHLDNDLSVRHLPTTAGGFRGPSVTVVADAGDQSKPQLVGSGDGGVKIAYVDSQTNKPGVANVVVSPADVVLGHADVSLAAPSQGAADLTSDGINFLNVFSSSNAYGTRLLAQRITPTGASLDAEPIVIADLSNTATDGLRSYEIVFNAGRYTIFYQNYLDPTVRARTITPEGVVGPVVDVMSTASGVGFNLDNASVNGDKLLLAGNSLEGSLHTQTRYFRLFDATTLAPLTDRVLVGTNFAINGDAEPLGPDRWVLAWQKKTTHDSSVTTTVYAVVAADGTIVKAQTAAGVGGGLPTIVSNGGAIATEAMIVSAGSNNTINGLRVGPDGTALSAVLPLVSGAGARTSVSGAYDGTNCVFTWTDQRNYPYPAQPRDDVFAARVAVDGTVLDPGGFAVADSFRPEGSGDVAVAGGKVVFVYRTFRSEVPFGSYRLAARGMDVADLTPPALRAAPAFTMETRQAVSFEFDKPLQNVDASDLVLLNTTTGARVPASSLRVDTLPAGGTSGWTYTWVYTGPGALPDGDYTATLPVGSVVDLAGVSPATATASPFFVLAGDANRDRLVDFNDLLVLSQNYGQTARPFSQGNFDYSPDGTVGFSDLLILSQHYGASLPALAGIQTVAATDRRGKRDRGNASLLA